MVLGLAAGIAAASWAGDFGIGGSLGNTNYANHFSSDTSSNRFAVSVEAVVPTSAGWEVDPYLTGYLRAEDGEYTTDQANLKTSEIAFGGRVYSVTKITDQFRFLIGAGAGLYFGENTWDDQSGDDQYVGIDLTVPVALEYRLVPNFGLRISLTLAGLNYTRETYDYGSVSYHQDATNFYLVNQNATVRLGAYYFF